MTRKKTPKATIASVARLSGVSTATAGRVLGDYGYSSPEVRERVLASAEQLGYQPNQLARSLITGTTKTIGVVVGDIQSAFYSSVLRGIYRVARDQGFGILLTSSDELLAQEIESVNLLLSKQVDGLIVAPSDLIEATHLRKVVASGKPVILIDRMVEGLRTDSVVVDNFAAAFQATSELIQSGHRRIGVVAELEKWRGNGIEDFIAASRTGTIDPKYLFPSWQRVYGYLRAIIEAGIEIDERLICRVGEYSIQTAENSVLKLLSSDARPTALFSTGGLMSAAIMGAVNTLDLAVPDDLSLICFDDLEWFRFHKPAISAIVQPTTAMGETAARLVFERIVEPDGAPRHEMLKTELIFRGSIMPV